MVVVLRPRYRPVNVIMDDLVPLIHGTVTVDYDDDTVGQRSYLQSAYWRLNNSNPLPDMGVNQKTVLTHFGSGWNRK